MMKPLFRDVARTGFLVACATAVVLAPGRLLRRDPAPRPPQAEEKIALRICTLDGEAASTMGVAINEKGAIVGTAFQGGGMRGFVFRGKRVELLPLPKGAPMSIATAINDEGTIVGSAGNEEKVRGVLWRGDAMGVLTSGQKNTFGTTVSKSGTAAGVAIQEERRDAFWSNPSHWKPLPNSLWPKTMTGVVFSEPTTAGFSGMVWQRPGEGKAIGPFVPEAGNASGTLVGVATKGNDFTPALFKDGRMTALPAPQGSILAIPLAINEAEVAVGAALTDGGVKPAGWSNGKSGFLPTPGNGEGVALGINDKKIIVGAIVTEQGEVHAALWRGGKVQDLNDLVEDRDGWTLAQARGINSQGYIVGTAIKGERFSAFVVGPLK